MALDPAMRVPWKAGEVICRPVVSKIIEEQKWIELLGLAEPECPAEFDAGAFDGGLGADDAFDWTNGHVRHHW